MDNHGDVIKVPTTRTIQNKTKEIPPSHTDSIDPPDTILTKNATPEKEPSNQPDPWAMVELEDDSPKFSDMTCAERLRFLLTILVRIVLVLAFLYLFICSLTLLTRAFQLIGGRTAGKVLRNSEILKNEVCGLMIGILVTVLLQSSSTSTSIVVALVASGMLGVRQAIPIVMGANIGTSVTNTIVSIAQVDNRDTFRRAFGGATVHDMFNWLSVIILLPVEVATGYLYHLTTAITKSMNLTGGGKKVKLLGVITEPFANLFVMLNKKVIEAIATGNEHLAKQPLLLYWCKTRVVGRNRTFPAGGIDWKWVNETTGGNHEIVHEGNVSLVFYNASVGVTPCSYLFHGTKLPEAIVGLLVLIISLFILISCLIGMVKVLQSLLKTSMASVIKKTINSDFPGPFACLTGYVALLVGAGVTVLVQSSSVFTSTLTPLVGMGVVTIERVYPLTLGSNIGTTITSFLAAMTATGNKLPKALQISFCHLFFNITGIVIFYPIQFMRKIPIALARGLGNKTARYRWFALLYLVGMFFLLPAVVFGVSLAGLPAFLGVFIPIVALLLIIAVINLLQLKAPRILPGFLRDWTFLPMFMRSLEPYDNQIMRVRDSCTCCKCCRHKRNHVDLSHDNNIEGTVNASYTNHMEMKNYVP